jgi:hypothetical protein
MQIGYGPEAYFSDSPTTPKWTARVRYKTTDMMMRGMGEMGGGDDGDAATPQQDQQSQQAPPKKRRGIGIGDILGSIPH